MAIKRKRPPPPLAYCTDSSGKDGQGLTAIYVLCADGGEPRYVGQTRDPRSRLRAHIRCVDRTFRARWIAKVLRSGAPLHMEIVDWTADPDGGESAWIDGLRKAGCRLVNATDGGAAPHAAIYPGIRVARMVASAYHRDWPALRTVIDDAVERATEEGPLALMTLDRDFALIAARGTSRSRAWL